MLEGGSVAANNGGSVSPSTDGHSNFLDGTDPLLPASLAGLKREDVVNEEGDPISPNPATCASGEAAVVKANKGMILRKSVEYIRSVFLSCLSCIEMSERKLLLLDTFNNSSQLKGCGIVS